MEYYQKYKELKKENHIFTFTGSLRFQDIVLLKELIERILTLQEVENKQKKRVINILIEALQNVQRHGEASDNKEQGANSSECLLLLAKEAHSYVLTFGNIISNSSISVFEEKLLKMVELSIGELKQLYLEMLDKGEITEKGGASLGLVKMYLDCNKNSFYNFYQIDNELSFFTIEFRVA